jgi:RNA polymerase sigma-70 factor, ECF subfamily
VDGMTLTAAPTIEEAFRAHRNRVYSICLRMLRDEAEAEDLTSEVFLQLSTKLDKFRGESSFTTWLHRVTVNQVLMHLRKVKKKRELTEPLDAGEFDDPLHAEPAAPDTMVMENLAIRDALQGLPPGYKNVLLLHDVEGYEHREIARILGCSEGTSKSQLNKARRKMRRLMNRKANPKVHTMLEHTDTVGTHVTVTGRRPRKPITAGQLRSALEKDTTAAAVATLLGVSQATLWNRLNAEPELRGIWDGRYANHPKPERQTQRTQLVPAAKPADPFPQSGPLAAHYAGVLADLRREREQLDGAIRWMEDRVRRLGAGVE